MTAKMEKERSAPTRHKKANAQQSNVGFSWKEGSISDAQQ
jgi:hypothetical protein